MSKPTAHELSAIGDVFETLSDWLLGVIAAHPEAVRELAQNELTARQIRSGDLVRINDVTSMTLGGTTFHHAPIYERGSK
jgi:hypothetical protein